MHSKLTGDEAAAAILVMKARIGKFLLKDSNSASLETVEASARTITVLQVNRVFKNQRPIRLERIDAASFDHLATEPELAAGPLLFFHGEPASPQVRQATDLLLDGRKRVRTATLTHLQSFRKKGRLISNRTLAIIDANAAAFKSTRLSNWQPAALQIVDAVENDLLLSIAGLRQCLAARLNDGYSKYMGRVLRPTHQSLEGFDLALIGASAQQPEIEQTILQIVDEATAWNDALTRYWRRYGHVPLGAEMSVNRLYKEWCAAEKPLPAEMFNALWHWSEGCNSPLARYHVCQLLVCQPNLVPSDGWMRLWHEIALIVGVPKATSSGSSMTLAWQVRCDLAKHYAHYLETRVPGQSSESLSLLAWDLAELVGSVFPMDAEGLGQLRNETLLPQYQVSANIWQVVSPPVRAHPLRYATMFTKSMWSLALLSQIGANLSHLSSPLMADEDRAVIEAELVVALLGLFPGRSAPAPAYGFEESPIRTAEAWSEGGLDPHGKIAILRSISERVARWDDKPSPLDSLGKGNEADDIMICQGLRVAALLGQPPVGRLWEMIQDEKWRNELLLGGSDNHFEVIADALLQIAVSDSGKWALNLPHFFAMACERCAPNRSRQRGLFACVIMACVASDTVSAVERLLKGPTRKELNEDVADWRKRLEALEVEASEWAGGKMRPVLAVLHV